MKNTKILKRILWGILVFFIVIVLLILIANPHISNTSEQKNKRQLAMVAQEIHALLNVYKSHCGKYPTTEQGLTELKNEKCGKNAKIDQLLNFFNRYKVIYTSDSITHTIVISNEIGSYTLESIYE